ncbi:MAG: alpha-amylase family glycosyl hydrolase [bacterium]
MNDSCRSISELDLSPIPGKHYWHCDREWREDFVYFLMVDRFHDDQLRMPLLHPGRSRGSGTREQLRRFYGGTLKGIRNNIDYIRGLGCTAIWLSPIFENNDAPDLRSDKYHGYAIQNYLAVDPRFGTKQDLIDLVNAAHDQNMRIFLDVVANHSGDNWFYLGNESKVYDKGREYPFGGWRNPDRPLPIELRNPKLYGRKGEICNWDAMPETLDGDFFVLKGFKNDESADGLALQDIIIKAHCYWMREADIDGFRMDAVKHMGELAIARFCSSIREYAYLLGKRHFLLFGELVAGDAAAHRYIGPNTPTEKGNKTVYFGLDSVLDFPLYWTLPAVLKGFRPPAELINRYEALRENALHRGEMGRYLITFLDNHDQIGMDYKQRFAANTDDRQVIAGVGYLLCALGTPCIYYGTEQGLAGEGFGDEYIREAMFELDSSGKNILNTKCSIYKAIAQIACVNQQYEALRFGRMYFREISGNGTDFGLPQGHPCTLAFSRILAGQEILVAYNTSVTEVREDYVIVDNVVQQAGKRMEFLYGGAGSTEVLSHTDPGNQSRFIRLRLDPMQFVILK